MEGDQRQNCADYNVQSQTEKEEGTDNIPRRKRGQRNKRTKRAQLCKLREDKLKKEEVNVQRPMTLKEEIVFGC